MNERKRKRSKLRRERKLRIKKKQYLILKEKFY